eukprot:3085331-Alexandrium_andersonii.AAC.1
MRLSKPCRLVHPPQILPARVVTGMLWVTRGRQAYRDAHAGGPQGGRSVSHQHLEARRARGGC